MLASRFAFGKRHFPLIFFRRREAKNIKTRMTDINFKDVVIRQSFQGFTRIFYQIESFKSENREVQDNLNINFPFSKKVFNCSSINVVIKYKQLK